MAIGQNAGTLASESSLGPTRFFDDMSAFQAPPRFGVLADVYLTRISAQGSICNGPAPIGHGLKTTRCGGHQLPFCVMDEPHRSRYEQNYDKEANQVHRLNLSHIHVDIRSPQAHEILTYIKMVPRFFAYASRENIDRGQNGAHGDPIRFHE